MRSPYTIQKFYKFLRLIVRKFRIFEKLISSSSQAKRSIRGLLEVWSKSLFIKYIATDSPKECNFHRILGDI